MAYSLSDYKRMLRNKKAEITNRKNKNQKLSKEIERLEEAYDKLKKIKKDYSPSASSVRSQVKIDKLAPDVAWRGKSKNKFDSYIKDDAKDAAKSFYKSIDTMLDQVSTKLSEKRGSYDTGIGILNSLNKSRTWLEGVIRNWVN